MSGQDRFKSKAILSQGIPGEDRRFPPAGRGLAANPRGCARAAAVDRRRTARCAARASGMPDAHVDAFPGI
jgi:hypothetical protein